MVGAASVGQILLDVVGIHLGAFGFVGGLIVTATGLEMMTMGEPSRVQGKDASRQAPKAADELVVPLAMMFVGGPGAITVVITLTARISDRTMNVIIKLGDLLIATIGNQLALNGIKALFEIGG